MLEGGKFLFSLQIIEIISAKKSISEPELIKLLLKKDKVGMEYLYDNYSSAIYGVILRIVRKEEVAEEVTNDCFLKIWNKIDQYDAGKGKLFTWMLNLARNTALDKLKTRELKKETVTDEIQSTGIDAPFESIIPEHVGVKEMLSKLSPDQKKLIDLMYFEGYTQSEIAEEFGIPLGTIKTRVRAAMNRLRSLF